MRHFYALALCVCACLPAKAGEEQAAPVLGPIAPIAVSEALPQQLLLPFPAAVDSEPPALAAPVAAAAQAASPVAQALAQEKKAVASLQNQGPISGERAKAVSDELFEGGARPAADEADAVSGARTPNFLLPSMLAPVGPRLIARTLREKISEQYHFRRLYAQNLYWYTITHITGLWPKYHAKIIVAQAKGAVLPVSSHRRFFSYMRVMGQTGKFYVLGFAPRGDKFVMQEARETFKKYFTSIEIGPEEEAAFDGFLGRVAQYNTARRNQTNMRKHIRDTMLTAAITPVDKAAEYFNGLFREDLRQQTDDFQQGGGQQKTLEAFRKAVNDTIAEEDPASKDRVVGVVLLGSFASGGATSRSDLDVEVLTANGHASRVQGFKKRLTDRWKRMGQHKDHPVSVKDFPDPPSRALIDRVHYFDYLVISPSPEIVDALARKPGEPPAFTASEEMGPFSPLLREIQYLTVYWTTVWSDLKALFA